MGGQVSEIINSMTQPGPRLEYTHTSGYLYQQDLAYFTIAETIPGWSIHIKPLTSSEVT